MKLKQIRVDGYKNLIKCEVNLGDFNVLVGPNNSGKSNILEAVQILGGICFGGETLRKQIFKGETPPPRIGSSICHLEAHKNKPLTIGIAFEMTIKGNPWIVDYEIKIKCSSLKNKGGFISETLTAKPPSRTGVMTTYIERQYKNLKVSGKSYLIANTNSALQAISVLYPDFDGLAPEFEKFFAELFWVGRTNVIALSPTGLRENIDEEKPIGDFRVSSFDLLQVIDDIKEKGKYYKLFTESLCDILDLEKAHFFAENMKVTEERKTKETAKRMRCLLIKRRGDDYCPIEEYSDGTFAVAAVLALLLSENVRGPVLYLEELENCLHPAAVEKLLRFLQDHSDEWPVLITTHSPYVLNGVNPEDVNVAIVDDTGATHFEKVRNTKQLRDYLKSGFMSFGDMLASNFEDIIGK